ncbi:hypothetical protein [Candidatus Villigracilis saccharophilus]|uniref:hypothetical protein n=1 Tax=Candidatus Villigracilis saccharophilus TaxID=3140684 RepID=UPI0031E57F11
MKKVFFVFVVMSALVLTACGASAEPTAIPTVSLNGNPAATAQPSAQIQFQLRQ